MAAEGRRDFFGPICVDAQLGLRGPRGLWRTDILEKHRKMWATSARKAPCQNAVRLQGVSLPFSNWRNL